MHKAIRYVPILQNGTFFNNTDFYYITARCFHHNLAVLPEYRHNGFGKLLLDHAKDVVKASGGNVIKIGIIEESTVLKNWYIANGFVHTGTKKFDHLPFTSGYLEWIGG